MQHYFTTLSYRLYKYLVYRPVRCMFSLQIHMKLMSLSLLFMVTSIVLPPLLPAEEAGSAGDYEAVQLSSFEDNPKEETFSSPGMKPDWMLAIDACIPTPSYSSTLDDAGTIVALGLLATPAIFLLEDSPEALLIPAVSCTITYGISYLVKNAGKAFFKYPRPGVSFSQAIPSSEEEELFSTFPSGHMTLASTAAAYVTGLYAELYPTSARRIPVTTAVWAATGIVAASRLTSGAHYLTDVVAGSILGSCIGILGSSLTVSIVKALQSR